MPSIAVIVPTLNRPDLLRETLASVAGQTLTAQEIIVVDDGSTEPIAESALRAEFGGSIRVLRNGRPEGLAWARNQGVLAATADYVTYVDDDDLLAPQALQRCIAVLQSEPDIEVLFVGTQGFGERAEHFDRATRDGLARVAAQAGGPKAATDLWRFDDRLMLALLPGVPMPFQRIVTRREQWDRVSSLRRRAYQRAAGVATEAEGAALIRGSLRDSEWALYAAATCRRTALLDEPLYLQRCEGQGAVSVPAMRARHAEQIIAIKSVMLRATHRLPELARWRSAVQQSLAGAHFDRAFQLSAEGDRRVAWRHWRRALLTHPEWRQLRLASRLLRAELGRRA